MIMANSGALPRLLYEHEAAAELRISIDTLRRVRKRGEIAARLIGRRWRYTEADLLEFQESRKVELWGETRIGSVKSPGIGSLGGQSRRTGTQLGMTMTVVDGGRAAHLLAQQIFGKPK
jgi:hypothetical protein